MKNNSKQSRNERFLRAVDYLLTEKMAENQKDLASKAKIQEATLSNIRQNKKIVSLGTAQKLCDAFPGLFVPQFFTEGSPYMLMEDYTYYQAHPEEDVFGVQFVPSSQRVPSIPVGESENDVLRELLAMREDVKKELELLRQERQHLQDVVTQLLQCMPMPHTPRQYEETIEQPLPVAAEDKK